MFDIVIKNGFIIDGTGNGGIEGDIGIKDGKITFIGDINADLDAAKEARQAKVIDATGKIVSPGFIDIHTHGDYHIIDRAHAENYLTQGVTTIIGGNCGTGTAGKNIPDYFSKLKSTGVNFGLLLGFGDIRKAAMQDPTKAAPTEAELSAMREITKKAMKDGAFGVSTGMEYTPDCFASCEEIVEVAKIAGQMGGFYATHSRNEQVGVLASVGEAIEIGKKADVPVHISHLKACGKEVWGYAPIMVSMITMARAMGLDVTADVYPYRASNTGFTQIYPKWALEGGTEKLKSRWADIRLREKIQNYSSNQIKMRVGMDFSLIQISACAYNREWEGKTMKDVLEEKGKSQSMADLLDLAYELHTAEGETSIIYHYISEADIKTIITSPFVMVASDGEIQEFGKGSPHPRSYGTFPRVFAHFVNELCTLTIDEAVKKMTTMPASRLKLKDRGEIKLGYYADITIFDEFAIKDNSTFLNPHAHSTGIEYVLVNGKIAVDQGVVTHGAFGEVVYGPGVKS